ncbi:hypothetical protein [Shewanella surugensis]|uniref:Deubiquitinating enzyme n=1 Tax=Shewanella surugensis TaxID=212020 RepID=A0ABT0L7J5_9GAMM|nr:hypothetical protein [Shewanella surugensis]MCL1123141.1 hypothetical protein [Shewanella surugensis]
MTSISPSATSFLHNIELDNSKQQEIDFGNLFTNKNITPERFDQLNLASTFDTLEAFAKNNDGESMEILCNLTARNDEIGKAATDVLVHIRNLSEEGSHRRELLDTMCNDLYKTCRNNETHNRTPQAHQLTAGMLEIILDNKLSTETDLNNDTQNLLHLLHQKYTQPATSSVVLTEDNIHSNVELSRQEALENRKQVLSKPIESKPSPFTLKNLELFTSQDENRQLSPKERLERAFGPITASQTAHNSTTNETESTSSSSLYTAESIRPRQQMDVQSQVSGSLMGAQYIGDTQSEMSTTSFLSNSSIGNETESTISSSSFHTIDSIKPRQQIDVQSQISTTSSVNTNSTLSTVDSDSQVLFNTPKDPNDRKGVTIASSSSTTQEMPLTLTQKQLDAAALKEAIAKHQEFRDSYEASMKALLSNSSMANRPTEIMLQRLQKAMQSYDLNNQLPTLDTLKKPTQAITLPQDSSQLKEKLAKQEITPKETAVTSMASKNETSSNEVYELMVGQESPLVTQKISPSTTDNQSKVTWYNPFSVMAASLNWAVGREFQDGRKV